MTVQKWRYTVVLNNRLKFLDKMPSIALVFKINWTTYTSAKKVILVNACRMK